MKESLQSLLQLEKGGQDKDGATVSRYTFSSQYMQQPKKLGGDLIKGDWFGNTNYLNWFGVLYMWIPLKRSKKKMTSLSFFWLVWG